MRALLASLALAAMLVSPAFAQSKGTARQIDYPAFAAATQNLESYRAARLVSLEEFHAMAREANTLILDARSADAFAAGHIAGAVNLPFTDFTSESLARVLGDPNTRILIYCNNNFSNDAAPVMLKRAPLALNIPTFINLHGYGYANIYELGEVVDFTDPAIGWTSAGG